MGILQTVRGWIGGRSEARSIAGADTWLPVPTLAGVIVTEETVAAIGAAYAAISVLSADVSAIPFQVIRRMPDGGRAIDQNHPVHELVFSDPDPAEQEMSALAWVGAMQWHLNTHGNAFSRIKRDRLMRPVGLVLLDPLKVHPRRSSYGKLYYDVEGEKFLPADLLHVANVGFDGIEGRSPIRQSRETLGLTMAVEKFGASYFGNGIHEGGMIEIPETLDEPETKSFRAGINREHQGPYQAHKFLLLQGGAKFTPTSITSEDAQFLATRKFQLEEICRIFRVPPTKLQNFDRANFANIEETNLDYYDSSLKPWLRRFEVEFNRKLFTPAERKVWSVEHDVSSMLKGRMVDQANVDKTYRDMGVLNTNEIRARRGWGPIKGGDTYFVPLNMAPLHMVAEASIETLKGVKPSDQPQTTSPDTGADVETTDADVQLTALNGAQIASMLSIVQQVASGTLPAGTAKGLIVASFPTLTSDQIDDILNSLDGFTPKQPEDDKGSTVEATRAVVLDVARRMIRRESNAIRKIARKGDLPTILEKLDEHYRDEADVLAEAYGSAISLYASVAGRPIEARSFAGELVARSRAELLACIEGPETVAAIAALADRWDTEKPAQVLDLLTRSKDRP